MRKTHLVFGSMFDRHREPKRYFETRKSYCSHFASDSVYFMRSYYLMLLLLRSSSNGPIWSSVSDGVMYTNLVTSLHWDGGCCSAVHALILDVIERKDEHNIIVWNDSITCPFSWTVSGTIWLNLLMSQWPFSWLRFQTIRHRAKIVRLKSPIHCTFCSETMSFRSLPAILFQRQFGRSLYNPILYFSHQNHIFFLSVVLLSFSFFHFSQFER